MLFCKDLSYMFNLFDNPPQWSSLIYSYPNAVHELGYLDSSNKIELELPGYAKNEVSVSFSGKQLKISAQNAKRSFKKTVKLPWVIEKVAASLENGILTLQLNPKQDEEVSVKVT